MEDEHRTSVHGCWAGVLTITQQQQAGPGREETAKIRKFSLLCLLAQNGSSAPNLTSLQFNLAAENVRESHHPFRSGSSLVAINENYFHSL